MDEQPSTLNAELGPKARLEIYSAKDSVLDRESEGRTMME